MDHRFKCKMIELVEENTGENLQDLGPGEEFLDMTPNTWSIKRKKKSINYTSSKVETLGTSLMVQWLRLCTSNWESSIETYTSPYVKQIVGICRMTRELRPRQPRGVACSGRRKVQEGGDTICLWLLYVDIQQKPIQYCKAIFSLIKNNF